LTNGNFYYAGSSNFFGVYSVPNSNYYGIGVSLPQGSVNGKPAAALAGYYSGLGIGGTSAAGTSPIFGVLNSSQSGNGLGHVAFTIRAGNQVYTYNNTLDDGSGNMGVYDGGNIVLGTTTGTQIAAATNQKLGFWAATPIVQPTTGVAGATYVNNAGTALTSTDTFDGYTIAQVVKALRTTGLLA
jgi:hypothetical protein